jgi:hypothetical protein
MGHLRKLQKTRRNKKSSKRRTRSYLGGGDFSNDDNILHAMENLPKNICEDALFWLKDYESEPKIKPLIGKLKKAQTMTNKVKVTLNKLYEED